MNSQKFYGVAKILRQQHVSLPKATEDSLDRLTSLTSDMPNNLTATAISQLQTDYIFYAQHPEIVANLNLAIDSYFEIAEKDGRLKPLTQTTQTTQLAQPRQAIQAQLNLASTSRQPALNLSKLSHPTASSSQTNSSSVFLQGLSKSISGMLSKLSLQDPAAKKYIQNLNTHLLNLLNSGSLILSEWAISKIIQLKIPIGTKLAPMALKSAASLYPNDLNKMQLVLDLIQSTTPIWSIDVQACILECLKDSFTPDQTIKLLHTFVQKAGQHITPDNQDHIAFFVDQLKIDNAQKQNFYQLCFEKIGLYLTPYLQSRIAHSAYINSNIDLIKLILNAFEKEHGFLIDQNNWQLTEPNRSRKFLVDESIIRRGAELAHDKNDLALAAHILDHYASQSCYLYTARSWASPFSQLARKLADGDLKQKIISILKKAARSNGVYNQYLKGL
jgi:hypothetical protein